MTITKQLLQRQIYINRDTLRFYWRQGGPGRIAGTLAGHLKGNGEQIIPLANRDIPASHVVWFLNHGRFPEWKIGYADKDTNNILIGNLIEIKKPESVDRAERKEKAKPEPLTIENIEQYIHDWMDLDEKQMLFRWKTTFGTRVAGRVVGERVRKGGKARRFTYMTPRGTHSAISYHMLAWIWHHGKYPHRGSRVYLYDPELGYAKENMTLNRAEYRVAVNKTKKKRLKKGCEYLFCNAPTTTALRSMNAKWRAANRETRDKEGLRGYDPWKVAARFEKALRALDSDYVNAVFDIENHRAIKRRI